MSKIIARTGLNHAYSRRLTPLHLLRTGNSFWNMSRFQEPTCKPAQEGLLLPEPNTVMLGENISPTDLPKCLKSPLLGNSLSWSLEKLLLKSELVLWELTHLHLLWDEKEGFTKFHIFTWDHGAQLRTQRMKKIQKMAKGFLLCREQNTEELKQKGVCPSQ